jgi:hypothetical protein
MFEFDSNDSIFKPLSSTEIGRIGEGLVARDLRSMGFQVFTQHIHQNTCDLIIMKGVQTLRVEVKTGRIAHGTTFNKKYSDIRAYVVLKSGKIRYTPKPESLILHFDDEIIRCIQCGLDLSLNYNSHKIFSHGEYLGKICLPCCEKHHNHEG